MDNDTDQVEVPITRNPLTQEQMEELRHDVDPLEMCDDYGIRLYLMARAFVRAVT